MQYASTSAIRSSTASGQLQVLERLVVDREETAGRAVLGRHVPDRGAVGKRQRGHARPEVLDELPDDAGLAQHLRHRQHQVGCRRALGQLAAQLEADDLRDEHRHGLPEHRGLCLDPADAPAQHAEAVDHRRVRVRPEQRVGKRTPVALLDYARKELEIHLVDDSRVRRHDLQVLEPLLTPAQKRVALAVSLELELRVPEPRPRARVLVHLHRVVDDELGRQQRVDA